MTDREASQLSLRETVAFFSSLHPLCLLSPLLTTQQKETFVRLDGWRHKTSRPHVGQSFPTIHFFGWLKCGLSIFFSPYCALGHFLAILSPYIQYLQLGHIRLTSLLPSHSSTKTRSTTTIYTTCNRNSTPPL